MRSLRSRQTLLVLFLFGLGSLLVALGYYYWRGPGAEEQARQLAPVEKTSVSFESLQGKIIVATDQGIQAIDPITSTMQSIDETFSTIGSQVNYLRFSQSGKHWVVANRTDWYLVNLVEGELRKISQDNFQQFTNQQVVDAIWAEDQEVLLLLSTEANSTDETENDSESTKPYTIYTYIPQSNNLQHVGSLTASEANLYLFSSSDQIAVIQSTNNGRTSVARWNLNGTNNQTALQLSGPVLLSPSYPSQYLAAFSSTQPGANITIFPPHNPSAPIQSISPSDGYRFSPTIYWSNQSGTFAIPQSQLSNPVLMQLYVSNTDAAFVQTYTMPNSSVVEISQDGRTVVIAPQFLGNNSSEETEEQNLLNSINEWKIIKPYQELDTTIIVEPGTKLLGIL